MKKKVVLGMLPRYFVAEMISAGIIDDETIITFSDYHTDDVIVSGHWFDDKVLNCVNSTCVRVLAYSKVESMHGVNRLKIEVDFNV